MNYQLEQYLTRKICSMPLVITLALSANKIANMTNYPPPTRPSKSTPETKSSSRAGFYLFHGNFPTRAQIRIGQKPIARLLGVRADNKSN